MPDSNTPSVVTAAVVHRLRDRVVYPVLIVLFSLLGAVVLAVTAPQTEGAGAERIAIPVRSLTVHPQTVRLHVNSQGTVEPRTESALISEVSGVVAWMAPAMVSGGRFETGDVLVRLDQRDYRNALTGAEAALQRAEAELAFTRSENSRMESLLARELASRSQAQNAARAFNVAQANLTEATAALDRARLDLARTEIRAPFSGRVRSEEVDVGQFVQRGGTLGTVYATDRVEIRLPIADTQLAFLEPSLVRDGLASDQARPGVQLSARYAGKMREWQGYIVRTEGEIDTRSRMVNVVASVESSEDGESPLPVGLFVKALIDGLLVQDAYVLPRAALRDADRVLVIDEDLTLRFRRVEILRLERDSIVVSAGLKPGERVCVSPLQAVVEGMPVTLYPDEG